MVEKAEALMGAKSVTVRPGARVGWSTCFAARVGGAKAPVLMERLQPKMGDRRSGRIAEVLDACRTRLPRAGKINAAQGAEIVERFRAGQSAVSLGEEYGISRWSVYALHQGRYFKRSA